MVAQRMCAHCGRGPFRLEQGGWLSRHYDGGRGWCPQRSLTQDDKLREAASAMRDLAHSYPTNERAAEWLHLANVCEWERLTLAQGATEETV